MCFDVPYPLPIDREICFDVGGRREWLRGMLGYELNTGPVGAKSSVRLFRSSGSASVWLVSEGTIIPLVFLLIYLYK